MTGGDMKTNQAMVSRFEVNNTTCKSWSAPSANSTARALLSKLKLRTKKAGLGSVIPLILPIRPSPKRRANGATDSAQLSTD
jgi:hypothetical protein